MTDYITLIEFVPGTKAKAEEVNANFAILKDSIEKKASQNGDGTKTFSVAAGIDTQHCVNKNQLDEQKDVLQKKINATNPRFCVRSGNTTNGKGDLLGKEGLSVTFKIGGTYPKLTAINAQGELYSFTSLSNLDFTGKEDDTYNLFLTKEGTTYALANKIYYQATRPALVVNDIWLNLSTEPISAIKYQGASDVEFEDTPLGSVKIVNSSITEIKTFEFNQNKYNLNSLSAKRYDSGWFQVNTGCTYVKTHNLGTTKFVHKILYAKNSDGSGINLIPFNSTHDASANCTAGCITVNMTDTTMEIKTGGSDILGFNPFPNDDGGMWGGGRIFSSRQTSGYYRILAEEIL